MKFGLNYHQHVLAKWANHYVDYNGLRSLIRANQRDGGASINEVVSYLEANIKTYKTFLLQEFESIAQQEKDIRSRLSLQSELSLQNHQFEYFQHFCEILLKEVKDLQWYERVNDTAIQRVSEKLASEACIHQQQWAAIQDDWYSDRRSIRQRNYDLESRICQLAELFGFQNSSRPQYNCEDVHRTPREDENILNDYKDNAALHHAVTLGHENIVEEYLEGLNVHEIDGQRMGDLGTHLGGLLLLAVRNEQEKMAQIILNRRYAFFVRSESIQSALYCASEAGAFSLVQLLVQYMHQTRITIDAAVPKTGWTALIAACANGHEKVALLLLEAGADAEISDNCGWTAQEHAAFRGHLAIAELDRLNTINDPRSGPALFHRNPNKSSPISLERGKRAVILTLGSVQDGHERAAFQLSQFDARRHHGLAELSMLSLEIHVQAGDAEPKVVQLPSLKDHTNEPFISQVAKDSPIQVRVRLHGSTAANGKVLLSAGAALLNHQEVKFGDRRESMVRETTVYMLDKDTMEMSGTVLLSYLIVTPYHGLQGPDTVDYRRSSADPVRLVGHRGFGQNTADRSHFQLGENTALSFLSAAKFGASFVEFGRQCTDPPVFHSNTVADLQITRDLEAVVFHDFSLSESGTDVPIHDVTLSQYKHASNLQEPQNKIPLSSAAMAEFRAESQRKRRAWSGGEESLLRADQLKDRLRYTVDFQNKGFKPNTRGHSIQGTLATLDELLVELPEDIGFNIEMKYPRLHEAVDAGVAPVTIDINTFVDTALEKIERLAGRRKIILSSFTPEMCILLSLKQKTYPVMFITNAGKVPMADRELRAASLQMGMQFCRYWNLAGIVLACETFLFCPRLIQFVKNAGLVCASYGLLNNVPVNARKQADAGIDIIMADRVRLIADELDRKLPN